MLSYISDLEIVVLENWGFIEIFVNLQDLPIYILTDQYVDKI